MSNYVLDLIGRSISGVQVRPEREETLEKIKLDGGERADLSTDRRRHKKIKHYPQWRLPKISQLARLFYSCLAKYRS